MTVTPTPPGGAGATRRTLFKAGGVSAAALFAPHVANAQVRPPVRPPSPPTSLWADELPVQEPMQPRNSLSGPDPGELSEEGECGRAPHPVWNRFPAVDFYRMDVKVGSHSFHQQLPTQDVWGFDGRVPGPMIHARYGRPMLVRFRNDLPPTLQGYGSPDISIHLHNMHTPSESDGFPMDWFSQTMYGPGLTRRGEFKDHHYPMVYAGLDAFGGIGDPNEALGTMWFHDHRVDFTASNVYRGMASFVLAFDHLDTGNETDPPPALGLPSGEFDLPLMIADKHFDSSGYVMFDQMDSAGFVGDKPTVNGKVQPFHHVQPRKYRLRLLNASTSRTMDLQLRLPTRPVGFQQIASDGNLFESPLLRSNVRLGSAERADLVVDFSAVPVGSEVVIVNRLLQLDGTKPEKDFLATPTPVMKFIVDLPLRAPDPSRVPVHLRTQPVIDLAKVAATRNFNFDRSGGGWTINDKPFDNKPIARPKLGTAEIWNLRNLSGGWAHPVHIHFEEGRILRRNGREPPPWERGRKDVYFLGPNETLSIYLRFRDFAGKYVMHCHNTMHEDHAMMGRYDIVT